MLAECPLCHRQHKAHEHCLVQPLREAEAERDRLRAAFGQVMVSVRAMIDARRASSVPLGMPPEMFASLNRAKINCEIDGLAAMLGELSLLERNPAASVDQQRREMFESSVSDEQIGEPCKARGQVVDCEVLP